MSIVHEAVCDGCGKREPAKYPRDGYTHWWQMASHPAGWFLVLIAEADREMTAQYQGYCSRRCVALGEVEG